MSIDFDYISTPEFGREMQRLQEALQNYTGEEAQETDTDTDTDPGMSESERLQRQQQSWEEEQARARRMREQRQIIENVQAVFSQYGLSSLNGLIEQYARQDMSAAAIEIALRQTQQYKARFPAMEALAAKGRAITEAEYIAYERTAASLERQYGLPADMLMNNVTDLLTNEVSASELNDRVVLASSAAIQAPEDFRRTMTEFYGIDSGGLTAYFLDPDVATPLLEKQYATSLIGTEARRQGVGVDVYGAENLQELGISQEQARVGFGQVARSQPLTEGRGDIVTQQQLIGGTFGATEAETRAVERARAGRVGRFQEGGQLVSSREGVTGAGTTATR